MSYAMGKGLTRADTMGRPGAVDSRRKKLSRDIRNIIGTSLNPPPLSMRRQLVRDENYRKSVGPNRGFI